MRIAVVGSGVAGVVAAHLLSRRHQVILFEKRTRLGGHTHTVMIEDGPDAGTAVDTGFIVCNNKTYPEFHRFLEELRVPWRWSNMSFGFWDEGTGLQYAGTDLNGLLAQRTNALRPGFVWMLWEITRFARAALRDLDAGRLRGLTLREYLDRGGYSQGFVRNYLLPMGAAIWSTRASRMLRFPAETLVRFFRNHGLLSFKDRPRWQTIVGGSHQYLRAFTSRFPGEIRLGTRIEAVERHEDRISLRHKDGSREEFDQVVFATHADQVLPLLADPSDEERRLFGAWSYEKNRVLLHTDESVMPPLRRAWASWNYTREALGDERTALSMTYYMNKLQGLRTERSYLVTLNRARPVNERAILRELVYTHPLYTPESLATQEPLRALSGNRRTWFAGSYLGYGFHEDAVRSALAVARRFAIDWETPAETSLAPAPAGTN